MALLRGDPVNEKKINHNQPQSTHSIVKVDGTAVDRFHTEIAFL